MVLKASRKKSYKLETRVLLLLFFCLALPVSSNNDYLDTMNMPVTSSSLTLKHCGQVLEPVNVKNNEIHMSAKFRNRLTKNSIISKRNNDIKILKKVRTQLKVARNHFRNNREVIARLYTDVKTVMQTDYHYEWLPSQPLVWYKKQIKKLDKESKVFILLPVLRDSLHNFSVTLEQMRQFSEMHYISNYTIRKLILDDLSKHLIAVLCEVESALISLSLWHDRQIPTGITGRTVIVDGPSWDPNPDHTSMMIQDWGVLTIYYRFLKDWLHISRKMIQDQLDTSTDVPADINDDADTSGDITASTASVTSDATGTNASTVSSTSTQSNRRPSSSPRPCTRHKCGGSSSKHKRRKSSDSVT